MLFSTLYSQNSKTALCCQTLINGYLQDGYGFMTENPSDADMKRHFEARKPAYLARQIIDNEIVKDI